MQTSSDNVIEVRGLRHRYKPDQPPALDGAELSVRRGQIFGILGPNGSGKSTLFKVLSTLQLPQSGEATIFGRSLKDRHSVAELRHRIGVVFQSPALDRMLTAAENLRHHGHLYGLKGRALEERVAASLHSVGMADHAARRTARMSGGERRRVELAKAMLHEPELLILDEPSTGLDPAARVEFMRQLQQLRGEGGRTVVLTTHLMEEADACDRLAIMDEGKTVACDTPAGLRQLACGEGVVTIEPAANDRALIERISSQFGAAARAVDGGIVVSSPQPMETLKQILATAAKDEIRSVAVRQTTLQDVFLRLTGKQFEG